ncbi:MAG: homoserine dehydrogenase [Candidatus Omnitrophica bacterium]|nr:homoserine dehydrogenase [Candidatus Omnitrophota bacterium]
MRSVNVALIGAGTVGSGVIDFFARRNGRFSPVPGLEIILQAVCDKSEAALNAAAACGCRVFADARAVLADERIQVVVELIGGIHPAKEFILEALRRKKFVVTANKALLAEQGEELFAAARENDVDIFFEAAVGGGIPIIKPLREGLQVNIFDSVYGIVNGTSNYILSEMAQHGRDFQPVLAEAQKRGYAEQDPTLDIEGIDAAHKLTVLARLCFGRKINFADVYYEGISQLTAADIRYAHDLGFCVKLLAIGKASAGGIELRVHPTLIPQDHLLAHVQGVFNAIFLHGDKVGDLLFYGRGAGKEPTAGAVIGDITDAARHADSSAGGRLWGVQPAADTAAIRPVSDLEMKYYIRFSAADEPGVLSRVAHILGSLGISIHSVLQKASPENNAVPIVMMTHTAKEKNMAQALREIDTLPVIKTKTVSIRVENL